MDFQNAWHAGLLLVLMAMCAGCRACGDEPEQSVRDQAVDQMKDTPVPAAQTIENDTSHSASLKQKPSLEPTPKRYPKIEMRPGAVVDMAKRPRDIEGLKRLSNRPVTKERSNPKGDQAVSDEHDVGMRGRPR